MKSKYANGAVVPALVAGRRAIAPIAVALALVAGLSRYEPPATRAGATDPKTICAYCE